MISINVRSDFFYLFLIKPFCLEFSQLQEYVKIFKKSEKLKSYEDFKKNFLNVSSRTNSGNFFLNSKKTLIKENP